jgi:hypothetical protein
MWMGSGEGLLTADRRRWGRIDASGAQWRIECRTAAAGNRVQSRPAIACLTIEEFCQRHRISITFYYKLRSLGQAPAEMRLGTRVLISKEAAEEWRRGHEQPPAA